MLLDAGNFFDRIDVEERKTGSVEEEDDGVSA
jgi:hypothetical protein